MSTTDSMSTTDQREASAEEIGDDPSTAPAGGNHAMSSFETVIRPSRGWIAIDWAELLHSHELFYTLVARDIKIRYKQTVLGVVWALIQPVFTMIVFTVVFGKIVGVKTDGVPYPLFALAAVVPWTFFTNAVSASGLSLITQQHLLTKIYFPRLYVPAATVGGFMVDLAIGLIIFAFMMPYFGFMPGWGLLALPFVITLTFLAALGLGLSLAASTVMYRDLRYVIPFALQTLMFVTPVIYKADILPRDIQIAAALNPMFGIINAYRASILGMPWDLPTLAISTASTAVLLIFGLFYFRKTERLFADIA